MGFKPGSVYPVCPWCTAAIRDSEDTGKRNGVLFHAGCLEDLLRTDTEVSEVRDASA